MAVTYVRLNFGSRDHERVSRQWYYLLHDLWTAGVRFNVNEGHRTMARQAELAREKGLWTPSNPTGAARPSSAAPHIRTGSAAHAIDFDNATAVVAAAAKRGVRLTRPIATEPWHVDPDAGDLRRYAAKHLAARAKARAKAAAKAKAEAARKAAAKAKAKAKPASKISARGVDLIASFEGCVLHPYRDTVGVWTIGYGHTAGVSFTTKPLKDEKAAKALLRADLDAHYEPPVRAAAKRYGLKLTQGQYDALTSAVYNLGPGILEPGRTLGAALKGKPGQPMSARMSAASEAFGLYVMAGGRKLPGLVRRREAERKLFLTR